MFENGTSEQAERTMILLEIIPGRDKDLLDAKSIVLRYKGKLDTDYLETWATKLCDEAEDMDNIAATAKGLE